MDVIEVGNQITLADLLRSTGLEDLTIAHVLMLISNAKSNLFKCTDKTDQDKVLQVDLQDLYRAIGQESMDAAINFIFEHTQIQDSYIELWKFAKGLGQSLNLEDIIIFNIEGVSYSCIILGRKIEAQRI